MLNTQVNYAQCSSVWMCYFLIFFLQKSVRSKQSTLYGKGMRAISKRPNSHMIPVRPSQSAIGPLEVADVPARGHLLSETKQNKGTKVEKRCNSVVRCDARSMRQYFVNVTRERKGICCIQRLKSEWHDFKWGFLMELRESTAFTWFQCLLSACLLNVDGKYFWSNQ